MGPTQIKLIKFVAGFAFGGTERQAVTLARALDRCRFDLHISCLRRLGHFLPEVEALGVPLVEYRIARLYGPGALKQQLRFAAYIKQNSIQIVHTYGFYPNVFAIAAAKLAGAAVVASIRDAGVDLRPMQKRAQRIICRLADCIVANAEAVRRWLIEEGYDGRKITVIRNGIDAGRFIGKNSLPGLRQELGLPADAPLVAVLSRLHPLKGVEYFLEAAAVVVRDFPQARFIIVGDRPMWKDDVIVGDIAYLRELQSRAIQLGLGKSVFFTGVRLDVAEILSEVAVSVLPSLSEGLSNTLLESMAAGIPMVATTVGGNPEVVQDGVTGFLVPPRQPEALANAICRLLQSREMAVAFGQAGRRRVAEHFSVEKIVAETEQLYLRLLDKSPHHPAF